MFDHERRDGQEFVVDVRITADFSAAAGSDDLADTIDYGHVGELVLARIVGEALRPDREAGRRHRSGPRSATRCSPFRSRSTNRTPRCRCPSTMCRCRATAGGSCRAVIGLGSNLGDRAAGTQYGLSALAADPATEVAAVSRVYATAPVGGPGATRLPQRRRGGDHHPRPLAATAAVSADRGGCRAGTHGAMGPRTLDLDILDFAGQRWADPDLTLPHPGQPGGRSCWRPGRRSNRMPDPGPRPDRGAVVARALPGDQPVALAPVFGLRWSRDPRPGRRSCWPSP